MTVDAQKIAWVRGSADAYQDDSEAILIKNILRMKGENAYWTKGALCRPIPVDTLSAPRARRPPAVLIASTDSQHGPSADSRYPARIIGRIALLRQYFSDLGAA
ncbi:hypothetical protein [Paraburkholderia sp. C35]|uniref:hypothetical protein n=1 Tax=Paraburkholderia sp. C35 TaxID=2126993 RepID=UPI0013A58B07|nr:hypothetical protein [Paraburkholderia sp. C35]